jgi:PhnB protein
MVLIPYLFFDGTCGDAMRFYAEVFGGTLGPVQHWSDMPPDPDHPVADEHKNRVMHARLHAKNLTLMASDTRPGTECKSGNVSLSLNLDDAARGEKLFAALASGGSIETPLADMFWGAKFGQCIDKFGIDWMFNITVTPAATT